MGAPGQFGKPVCAVLSPTPGIPDVQNTERGDGPQFLAAVQVLVYAGAIMVLFLFVITLLNPLEPEARKTA